VDQRGPDDLAAVPLKGGRNPGVMTTWQRQAPPARAGWLVRMRLAEPRALALQAALVLLTLGLAADIAANVAANVARLNLHVGFGFLRQSAGFEIAQSLISYSENATYFRAFWVALLNTVLISAVAIVGATALGLVVALARLASNPLLSFVARAYVEAGRNIPLLLQLFFWYFAVLAPLPLPRQSLGLFGIIFLNKRGLFLPAPMPQADWPVFAAIAVPGIAAALILLLRSHRRRIATGQAASTLVAAALVCVVLVAVVAWIARPVSWDVPRIGPFNTTGGIALIPEFVALAVGLIIYGSAFVAELIRAGILTVGRGQIEAGLALGLSRGRIYASVAIPQALRAITLPMAGEYISLIKNSSLAAAIGYPDLMMIFGGTVLNQTGQPLETMAMTMASYLVLCLFTSAAGQVINRRIQRMG
jgi:general L-amino acid transport system permease protein